MKSSISNPIKKESPTRQTADKNISRVSISTKKPEVKIYDIYENDTSSIKSTDSLEEKFRANSNIIRESLTGSIPNGPVSLAYLAVTERFFFKRCKKKKLPSSLSAFRARSKNFLEILDNDNRTIYYAGETKTSCNCPRYRERFTYEIVDLFGRSVIFIDGRQSCTGCRSSVDVELGVSGGTKEFLGSMKQDCCDSTYRIRKSGDGDVSFKIQGPCYATYSPCVFWSCDERFEIDLSDGIVDIGKITKCWSREKDKNWDRDKDKNMSKEKDGKDRNPIPPPLRHTLGLSLPLDMDVREKALIIGSFFLIKYQYYKRGGNGVWICFFFFLITFLISCWICFSGKSLFGLIAF